MSKAKRVYIFKHVFIFEYNDFDIKENIIEGNPEYLTPILYMLTAYQNTDRDNIKTNLSMLDNEIYYGSSACYEVRIKDVRKYVNGLSNKIIKEQEEFKTFEEMYKYLIKCTECFRLNVEKRHKYSTLNIRLREYYKYLVGKKLVENGFVKENPWFFVSTPEQGSVGARYKKVKKIKKNKKDF